MRRLASFLLLAVLCFSGTGMVYARSSNSPKAQARAARKLQKRQMKANKKFAKAQRKRQQKMFKQSVKKTHYPHHNY